MPRRIHHEQSEAKYPAHTVPRSELCAAVLAAEMADTICSEMDIEMYAVRFFTDSRIVLGYIHNTSRRFHMYVANRVNRIRKSSTPQRWQYVTTEQNPAEGCCLRDGIQLSKKSQLRKLSPFIDEGGLLRIGGRLTNADLPRDERHPVILPETHHIATLIVRHYYEEVVHQGRHFTLSVQLECG